jgi:hypothetical protein
MSNKKIRYVEQEEAPVKVETLTLDDGRRAERHITLDEQGNEIVEIFAEEQPGDFRTKSRPDLPGMPGIEPARSVSMSRDGVRVGA